MKITLEEVRAKVKKLLEEGTIHSFIGYEEGSDSLHVTPCFLNGSQQVSRLVWNPLCANNLSKYLLDYKTADGRVGIIVKGCDARSVVELLKQNQIERERVFIVGVTCRGMVDPDKLIEVTGCSPAEVVEVVDDDDAFLVTLKGGTRRIEKGELLRGECLVCKYPAPVIYDVLLGETVTSLPWVIDDYGLIKEQERLSSEEKSLYWNKQFSQCIRCYACRDICPACTCRECIFDKKLPRWLSKSTTMSENQMFHLVRAFHVAGRCVDCGECERACPMKIPLRRLNKKIEKDISELFGYTAGVAVDQLPPLATYQVSDLEEFI
jgi:coenzyme F420-reducing hydrogenase beta subunit